RIEAEGGRRASPCDRRESQCAGHSLPRRGNDRERQGARDRGRRRLTVAWNGHGGVFAIRLGLRRWSERSHPISVPPLRHTWASWRRQAGTSTDELKDLGGGKSRVMVDRYAKFATEHLSGAASAD